jgi:menaquinone-dependent protoporphyrinogen oxidase
MSRILVVYASHFGQAHKIAERLAQRLRAHGHDGELRDAKDLGPDVDLLRFDGIILGGSVHRGDYPREVTEFVRAPRGARAGSVGVLQRQHERGIR